MGGSRIPPQDLPIPGKDSYGTAGRRDPLLDSGRPAVRGEKTDRTENSPPPTKKNDAAAAPTSRSPYRPGRSTTPASLAGRIATDDSDLSIGSRPAVVPAGGVADGPVKLRPRDDSPLTGGRTYDEIADELRDHGAEWKPPEKDLETGQYVFDCNVPIGDGSDGRVRRYMGNGPTPAAAAKQVLDQVRADAKSR